MIRTIAIIGFLSFGVAFNAYANDSDRIDQLEKEVQGLNNRISKLESLLDDSNKPKELVHSNNGWKLVNNWRKLTTDMNANDVRKILGEPQRIDGGSIAFWTYKNGGKVTFMDKKVYQWVEPTE